MDTIVTLYGGGINDTPHICLSLNTPTPSIYPFHGTPPPILFANPTKILWYYAYKNIMILERGVSKFFKSDFKIYAWSLIGALYI